MSFIENQELIIEILKEYYKIEYIQKSQFINKIKEKLKNNIDNIYAKHNKKFNISKEQINDLIDNEILNKINDFYDIDIMNFLKEKIKELLKKLDFNNFTLCLNNKENLEFIRDQILNVNYINFDFDLFYNYFTTEFLNDNYFHKVDYLFKKIIEYFENEEEKFFIKNKFNKKENIILNIFLNTHEKYGIKILGYNHKFRIMSQNCENLFKLLKLWFINLTNYFFDYNEIVNLINFNKIIKEIFINRLKEINTYSKYIYPTMKDIFNKAYNNFLNANFIENINDINYKLLKNIFNKNIKYFNDYFLNEIYLNFEFIPCYIIFLKDFNKELLIKMKLEQIKNIKNINIDKFKTKNYMFIEREIKKYINLIINKKYVFLNYIKNNEIKFIIISYFLLILFKPNLWDKNIKLMIFNNLNLEKSFKFEIYEKLEANYDNDYNLFINNFSIYLTENSLDEKEIIKLIIEFYINIFNLNQQFLNKNFKNNYNNIFEINKVLNDFLRNIKNGEFKFLNYDILLYIENIMETNFLNREYGIKEKDFQKTINDYQLNLNFKNISFFSEYLSKNIFFSFSGFLSKNSCKYKEWDYLIKLNKFNELYSINYPCNDLKEILNEFCLKNFNINILQDKDKDIALKLAATALENFIKFKFINFTFETSSTLLKYIIQTIPYFKLGHDSLVDNPFNKTYEKTIKFSEIFAKLIKNNNKNLINHVVNLISFSLGTVFCYYFLINILKEKINFEIGNVFLMGSCLDKDIFIKNFYNISKLIKGKIYIVYSNNDDILKYVFKISRPFENPIGLNKIENYEILKYINKYFNNNTNEAKNYLKKKLKFVDVSKLVGGHTNYREKLDEIFNLLDLNSDLYYYFKN